MHRIDPRPQDEQAFDPKPRQSARLRGERTAALRRSLRFVVALVGAAAVVALLAPADVAGAATAHVAIPLPESDLGGVVREGGSVFALSSHYGGAERNGLTRVNPRTDTVTGRLPLPAGLPQGDAAGGPTMIAAAGSVWIVFFFHHVVLRIDPYTLTVIASIGTGRGPAGLVFDGSSVWVVTQGNPGLERIDPALNAITQTVRLGNARGGDGPWEAAFAAGQLLVSLPGDGDVAHVDPSTGRVVRRDHVGFDAASCAVIHPVAGGYWLDDTLCSFSYYRWDAASGTVSATVTPPRASDFGMTVTSDAMYTAEDATCTPGGCHPGYLVRRDLVTGAQTAIRKVSSNAYLPFAIGRSIWFGNYVEHTLNRYPVFGPDPTNR